MLPSAKKESIEEAFTTILAPDHVGAVHRIISRLCVCAVGGSLTLKCQIRSFLVHLLTQPSLYEHLIGNSAPFGGATIAA